MKITNLNWIILLILLSLSSAAMRDPRQLIQYYQSTRYTFPNGRILFDNTDYPMSDLSEVNNFYKLPVKQEVNSQSILDEDNLMSAKIDLATFKYDSTDESTLEEGSFCRRSFDKRSGYCILAFQCLHVIRAFRLHGTKIDVCGYKKNVPIICCPLEDKDVHENTPKRINCERFRPSIEEINVEKISQFSGKTCVGSVPMIVGGRVTKSGEYPHMAGLGWSRENDEEDVEENIKWGCGASLISDIFVLTAAHCTESGGNPPDIVRLGAKNINSPSKQFQDIKINKIILHPKYRASSYYHDIALLKLVHRVKFNEFIQPICLWPLSILNIPTAIATGWGRTEFLGSKSDDLQQVDLQIIDQPTCKDLYKTERRLPKGIIEEQFCAGHLDGGKDTCQGDSGGPIHIQLPETNCVQFLIGITSFGKFCAAPNAPGVYTRIYSYLNWIEKHVFL